jgi:hypothetical protein
VFYRHLHRKLIAFSTLSVLPHHPIDIIDRLVSRLEGTPFHEQPELVPWFRGFEGEVVLEKDSVKVGRLWRLWDILSFVLLPCKPLLSLHH